MTRKIVESTFVTLDGMITNPQEWSPPYWDDQHGAYAASLLEPAEALLLGRATYDGFAAAWPTRSGDPYTDKINAMPKYVASRTMTPGPADWNATVLDGHAVDAIEALLKFGTGALSQDLLARGLVDEYHFWM